MAKRTIQFSQFLIVFFPAFFLAQSVDKNLWKAQINLEKKYQTIDNFAAAGCWFAEGIGKYWPEEKKQKIAQLLFSRQTDDKGNPLGIGLSGWRFNIGAGTQEQADKSGISDFRKRVECFQNPDGSYSWNRQEGYQWFLKKAKEYGVERLIAFSNSPPVFMTKNGLGFKTEKDNTCNLPANRFSDFAKFLAEVVEHFEKENLHFDYLSPVNEPQWDWFGEFGKAKQEGSPWSNADISEIAKILDKELSKQQLNTKILLTEAAQLDFLYAGYGPAQQQVSAFYDEESPQYLGNLTHLPKIIAGHSYFTESSDKRLLDVRKKTGEIADKYRLNFWQSEYSMLGKGYTEGKSGQVSAIDCALFLAKVIHFDLTVANASAWQFWNAFEPGPSEYDTRYYFIALDPNETYTNGNFHPVKTLWAMGHYSYFIRPGMQRIDLNMGLSPEQQAQEVMASAYQGPSTGKVVVVLINYSPEEKTVKFDLPTKFREITQYLTTKDPEMNMKKNAVRKGKLRKWNFPPRSISTLVFEP
ncbi:O-Glycosyl hydrolase [Epilithonimonas bovis DSM 19482]|uniref:Endo-beta-1,6-galactanase-like domain-containing protein n=2 Tax=Chryseobacterium group TaxID=2782232 RepID=A0A246B6N3_9FLAO|nr:MULTISPECIES: glycoside hydrolase [Chryseobacterium group]OWK97048.1 hypothetical protein AP75_13300 [Kaistella haifensis DSM 19056]SIT95513.1 O-Glycosyl hydrolase [Epilithonimonas bovis DSM 19482]